MTRFDERLGRLLVATLLVTSALGAAACGDDDASEAIRSGVGDACTTADDCMHNDQECLTEFKAGYCGRKDCAADIDCPDGSACVTEGGANYCFLVCVDKVDCNVRRDPADEANCSGSADFVDNVASRKACIPPSGS